MNDEKLFTLNGAISRKGYFINLILLVAITSFTYYLFSTIVPANIKTEEQLTITKYVSYFLYAIYTINFFALIDRRLLDIFSIRESNGYKHSSLFIKLLIFIEIISIYSYFTNQKLIISVEFTYQIAIITALIFFFFLTVIGFIKGKSL